MYVLDVVVGKFYGLRLMECLYKFLFGLVIEASLRSAIQPLWCAREGASPLDEILDNGGFHS